MLNYYFDSEEKSPKSFELPGAKPHYNPDRPGQVKHIFLDLALDIPNQSFEGTCTIILTPVRQGITRLVLDAVDLAIESVLVDEVAQDFDYDGNQLIVHLVQPLGTEPIKIEIAYQAVHPQRGLYFVLPDEYYPDKPTQVWTQGEDEDSRFWFPCLDYPGQLATSEIRVRVPQGLVAISNGKLVAVKNEENAVIFHWQQEEVHPTYLMTLAVGNFAVVEDKWEQIPLAYYTAQGREEDGRRSMGKTPKMMGFLSQKYGYTYPYPKYAQVCVDDFIFGGMENTSCTLLTDRCLLDERAAIDNRNTESLVLHELAHQWFGDLVVIKHWSHAWIKEGMASYAEVLWTEAEYGPEDAAYYLLGEARNYLQEDSSRYRRPIVTNIYREAIELYDRHLYEKGACVYHMIRSVLGDELFEKAIQTFVRDNAHHTVETMDLLRAIDKSTGYNLAFLFDQYVFRGGHPDFKVNYSWDGEGKIAKLTVTQTQVKAEDEKKGSKSGLFDLTIPISFGYKGEAGVNLLSYSLRIKERQQSFYFPLTDKPDFISFDAGNNFLKTVTLEYPVGELKAQLQLDPDPIARIYAAIALAKKGGLAVVKALATALKEDRFWGVRLEAAKQLGKLKLNQAMTALIEGLEDDNARVRRAVIQALSNYKLEPSYQQIKQVAVAGDQSYYVEATALRCLGTMVGGNLQEKEQEVLDLFKQVLAERSGWNETVRSGAIAGLSKMKTSAAAVDLISSYTKLGVPQPLRLASIRALGSVSTGQTPAKVEEILEVLEAISGESFFLVQTAVVGGLQQMETPKAMAILTALAEQTPDGRVRRRAEEAVTTVQKKIGSDKALKELRQELDKLKQDNQELQSRLAKLEASSLKK